MSSDVIAKLAELFQKLPGIGPRQAKRFVYYCLQAGSGYTDELIKNLVTLQSDVLQCDKCQRYYVKGRREQCELCLGPSNPKVLLVVEKDADLENIRRSGSYHGWYFVLGGLLQILEDKPHSYVRIRELKKRIVDIPDLEEVILALSVNALGENTVEYIKSQLKNSKIKISVLGRGLSTGSELEYSDHTTLSHALENRR